MQNRVRQPWIKTCMIGCRTRFCMRIHALVIIELFKAAGNFSVWNWLLICASVVGWRKSKMATRASGGADVVRRRNGVADGEFPQRFYHRRFGKTMAGDGGILEQVVHVQSLRRSCLLPLRKQQFLTGVYLSSIRLCSFHYGSDQIGLQTALNLN